MALSPLARKDVKWVMGIIAFLLLLPAVFFAGVYQITKEEPARAVTKGIVLTVVDSMIEGQAEALTSQLGSQGGGLTGPGGRLPGLVEGGAAKAAKQQLVTQLKREAAKNPGAAVAIPGVPVEFTITGQQLSQTPDDKVLDVLADDLAGSIYKNGLSTESGSAGSQAGAGNDSLLGGLPGQSASMLGAQTHAAALGIQITLLVPAVIFLLLVIFFSSGSGRAVTPGIIISLAALPAVVVYSTIQGVLLGVSSSSEGGEPSPLVDGLQLAAGGANRQTLIWLLAGLTLTITGLIWAAVRRSRGGRDTAAAFLAANDAVVGAGASSPAPQPSPGVSRRTIRGNPASKRLE